MLSTLHNLELPYPHIPCMLLARPHKGRRTHIMALLKILRYAQITLPAELRRQFNLAEGNYLEAQATKDGILLKPVSVVEREKA